MAVVEKWFKPKVKSGWKSTQSPTHRRRLVMKAHKGDLLTSARSMQALANIQVRQHPLVAKKASADATYFYQRYRQKR